MRKIIFPAIFLSALLFILTGCDGFSSDRNPEETLSEWQETTISITETSPAVTETESTATTAAETATAPETTAETTVTTVTTTAETTVITTTLPPETTTVITTAAVTTTAPVTQATEVISLETVPPTTPAAVSKPSMTPITEKYTYSRLNAGQQNIYDKILAAAENGQQDIYLDTPVSLENLIEIYHAVLWEEPSVQYLNGSEFHYSGNPVKMMRLSYAYSKEQSDSMNNAVEQRVEQIVSGLPRGASTFDAVKYFHDTVINNCVYDLSTEYCGTAYGALVEGRALCQGYAFAFAALCNRVGIENTLVTGYAGEEHMWNMVKVNGRWYHIDLTWDDPEMSDGENYLTYDYFLVSDKDMSERTIHKGLVERPAANSTAENYFVYNGLYADSYEKAKKIVYTELIKRSSLGEDYVYIKLSTPELFEETKRRLFDDQGIYSLQQQALLRSTRSFDAGRTLFLLNEETNTILIQICY